MTFEAPVFLVHDVLQESRFTPSQCLELTKTDFFTDFKETMKLLEGQKIVLLIVAAGIDEYPEWVEYIKQHPEWKVELHCLYHEDYSKMEEEKVYKDLKEAKQKIEETFNQKVTWYYPPRNHYNDMTDRIAKKLGVSVRKRYNKVRPKAPFRVRPIDVHYWFVLDRQKTERMIEFFKIAEPIFIIGAPRSGTTALMRHLGKKIKDAVVLKEVERIWHNNTNIYEYYTNILKKNNAKVLIDKNVRNSLRIRYITKLFPHAKFIHLIRDGRAEATSWRKWAIKTNKPDQTIEGAARQWVEYLDAIQESKNLMKNYEEIRYEDLCKDEDYFVSRDFKWKKDLTPEEVKIVEEIQGKWLRELGYK